MTTSDLSDKLLQLLVSITGTDEVRTNLDLALYDYDVLDSMKTVELMVAVAVRSTESANVHRLLWRQGRP